MDLLSRISETTLHINAVHLWKANELYQEYSLNQSDEDNLKRMRKLSEMVIKNVLSGNKDIIPIRNLDTVQFDLSSFVWEQSEITGEIKSQYHFSSLSLEKSSSHIARLLKLMRLVIRQMISRRFMKKREVYYSDVNLFESMENVDQAINELKYCLKIPRRFLKITASSKGLVSGSISYKEGSSAQDLSLGKNHSLLIHELIEEYSDIKITGKFVLIVEKETVFFNLLTGSYQDILGPCVMVTGKGYPDLATKLFLKRITVENPELPFFYLGDCDPHGLDILLNYVFSSPINTYELDPLPHIHRLGLSFADLEDLCTIETHKFMEKNMIKLSENDVTKINEIQARSYWKAMMAYSENESQGPSISRYQVKRWLEWKNELEKFSLKKMKAEVEIIETISERPLAVFIRDQITKGAFV